MRFDCRELIAFVMSCKVFFFSVKSLIYLLLKYVKQHQNIFLTILPIHK